MYSQANRDAWLDYHSALDELLHTHHIRNLQQVMGEHAKHLIQTGINFGRRAQQLLWDDGEQLTDLANEWVGLTTSPTDPHTWKRAAVKSIRSHSKCARTLIAARIDKEGYNTVYQRRTELHHAVNMAAAFHAELDRTNWKVHAKLKDAWELYREQLDACTEALATRGPESTRFFKSAAAFIRTAQMVGGLLDTLYIK